MGVGAGIFRMRNASTKTVDLINLPEQEICLDEACAQSASEDKLMAADFDAFLNDGLIEKTTSKRPMDSSSSKT